MTYQKPSARRRKASKKRLDLVPIMDAVFILIFFLLMSAQFVKIYEIGSDLPVITDAPPPPPDQKPPLNLTLTIEKKGIRVTVGNKNSFSEYFPFESAKGNYDLEALHNLLVDLKAKNPTENTVSLIPEMDVSYDSLVKIMDTVRMHKHKTGEEEPLFNQIVFDNLI